MAVSRPRLRPAFWLLLLVALFVPQATGAEPLPLNLPTDWAAVLSVRGPAVVVKRARGVLDAMQVEWPPLDVLAGLDAERLHLERGVVHLGMAVPDGQLDGAYLFALAPAFPSELAQTLGGEMADDVAILSLGGTEFVATRRGGTTMVLPAALGELAKEALRPVRLRPAGDITLTVSPSGLELLKQRSALRARRADSRCRVQLNELGWPPSAKWLDAAIATNAPLVERIAELFTTTSLGVTITPSGGVAVRLSGVLRFPPTSQLGGELASGGLPKLNRPAIASAAGGVADGSLSTLARLILAYSRGRPDEVEIDRYPPDMYRKVEEKALEAIDQIESLDAALLSRKPGDPFQSNRVAMLKVKNAKGLVTSLRQSAEVWNAMLEASSAKSKLVMEIEQHALLGDDRPVATRFTTDVARAIEPEPTPETRAIMRKYYGPSGKHALHIAPLGDGLVLVGDLPAEDLRKIANAIPLADPPSIKPLAGECRVDRYAAWQNAILADYMQDAIGFKPRKKIAAVPLGFSIRQANGKWDANATLPKETIETLGRFLIKKSP